jgi:general secretion pathway protein D
VEPTIYLDSDVAIKVNLEVSSILKEVPGPNGSLAYQIGTRDASTLLRLRDGETQILAGLINDQDTRNSQHIPGLGDIPVIGRLFGSERTTRDKSEIVLSITPRIIRAQPRPRSDTTEFWYGTETSIRGTPFGATSVSGGGASGAAAARGASSADSAVTLSVGTPAADAAPADPASPGVTPSAVTPPPPATTSVTPMSSRLAAGMSGAPSVAWDAPGQVSPGQDFDVVVRFSGGEDLRAVRSQLHYDTSVLQLQSAEAGDVVPAGNAAVPRLNQIAGVVQFVVNATPEAPAHGDGGLMTLHFKALAPNPGTRVCLQMALVGASGAALSPTAQQPLTIVVAP